ncbi:MAG: hypothetical protein KJ970_18895 [Candidatus Eisenbacteria bacterium]|uniref:Uncharacterized protein n=1 Tax=Eiseniibacteriota bacterium TaxID=2212470 RepID=A0A948RYZ5_UNCEI|nr:hypothetical protein [Candidatus Eisenbacteria bacterium]MBU2692991.1 hypothetical protein [Candidatus Eisenbacteria bacterium]
MIMVFLRWVIAFLVLRIIWKLLRGLLGSHESLKRSGEGADRRTSKAGSKSSTFPWDEKEITDVGYEEVNEKDKVL